MASADPVDIPSPIDLTDPAQARAWIEDTDRRRPWRPRVFSAYVAKLNAHFDQPIDIAELGSGPGRLAAAILAGCDCRSYVAIDFSAAMHELARDHLGERAQRVRFLLKDFRLGGWSEEIGVVDAIVTMQAAHEVRHVSRVLALFQAARASIRPRGLFLYADHFYEAGSSRNRELFLTLEEQVVTLQAAGFWGVERLLEESGLALYAATAP
jgi:SAM-dependent methyltransferase